MNVIDVPGPFYDDLLPGQVFESPPAVTIDSGLAAMYQAIVGEALALTLDAPLAQAVTGRGRRLASPGLVLHMSIGASTVATKRVLANLFYRNVRLARPVFEGETLHTTTKVLAMADGSTKPGKPLRGKVLLGITTTADGEPVINYERCPLIRLRGDKLPGHNDDLGNAASALDLVSYAEQVPSGWDLSHLTSGSDIDLGVEIEDPLRDVVDGATALVRLTHNVAAIHRDVEASPYSVRLVYGGHTVALAQASLSRVLPSLVTVVGWHSCDHVGPVFEGDVLSFRHTSVEEHPISGGRLRAVRVVVSAHRATETVEVLDWTPVVFTT